MRPAPTIATSGRRELTRGARVSRASARCQGFSRATSGGATCLRAVRTGAVPSPRPPVEGTTPSEAQPDSEMRYAHADTQQGAVAAITVRRIHDDARTIAVRLVVAAVRVVVVAAVVAAVIPVGAVRTVRVAAVPIRTVRAVGAIRTIGPVRTVRARTVVAIRPHDPDPASVAAVTPAAVVGAGQGGRQGRRSQA